MRSASFPDILIFQNDSQYFLKMRSAGAQSERDQKRARETAQSEREDEREKEETATSHTRRIEDCFLQPGQIYCCKIFMARALLSCVNLQFLSSSRVLSMDSRLDLVNDIFTDYWLEARLLELAWEAWEFAVSCRLLELTLMFWNFVEIRKSKN